MMRRIIPFFVMTILMAGVLWARDEGKVLFKEARALENGADTAAVDPEVIFGLYRQSAEKGYTPAMNYIGFMYYNGEGVEQTVDSALYWIRKAGVAGDLTAATNLGYLLTEGEGVAKDEEEALEWLAVAADAGVEPAQHHLIVLAEKLATPKALTLLGDAYAKGIGVPYDHRKSIEYFHRGAEGGNPSAQFIVAELLEIFPDTFEGERADYWYEKAAEGGVTDSEEAYRVLYAIPVAKKIEDPAATN